MSEVNETRFKVPHESRKCKLRLNKSVYNSKKKWKHDKCCSEYKNSDDCSSCEKVYMWNPCTYDYECNKACNIDEYIDIKNCSC